MPVGFGVDSRRATRGVSFVLISVLLLASARHADGQDPVPKRPLGRDVLVYQPAPGGPERREVPPIQNPTGTVCFRPVRRPAMRTPS